LAELFGCGEDEEDPERAARSYVAAELIAIGLHDLRNLRGIVK
jgi:hypothetical protein